MPYQMSEIACWPGQHRQRALAALCVMCGLLPSNSFAQEQAARDTINVMNADGSELRPLFVLPGFPEMGSPAVSPDGRKVAFDGWQEGQNSGNGRVFIVNRDGSRLIELGEALMPTWSPDGRFVSVSRSSPAYGAWIMAIDGSTAEHLSRGWGAQWSPDGKMIATTSGPRISIHNVASGDERDLFPSDFQPYRQIYWNMAWSPDSKRLCILGRGEADQQDVATFSTDDPEGSLKVHHSGTRIYADFAWHPDGDRIVFPMYNTERSRHQLYEFNPDGDDPPTLLTGQNPNRANTDVTWTPDGHELIFVSR